MSLLGFSASSPVSTLLPALLWCTACSWALFSPEGGSTGDLRSVNSTKPPKGRVSLNAACTLSSSENSIRSSGVQLRPMGEMFSIPLRNSMKVPLCVGKSTRLLAGFTGAGREIKRLFQGNGCSARYAASAGTCRRRGAVPTHGCSCFSCARASKVAQEPRFSRQRPGFNSY